MKNIEEFEEHVIGIVREYAHGAGVLVTVSGGADSVALLCVLSRCGYPLLAAHCNFHLRGEESNRDERFVRRLCDSLGVMLVVKDFDVESRRLRDGVSMEMACRDLRYEWFRELVSSYGLKRILTAHHANDNVETMLLNMLRGTGIEGAKGMMVDSGEILRPLLRFARADIEEYLHSIGQGWIVDSTNLYDEPDRNFIRLNVLPLLEQRWGNVVRRLDTSRRNLGRAFCVYDDWARGVRSEHPVSMSRRDLLASVSPITTLHEWLKYKAFSSAQLEEMLRSLHQIHHGNRFWTSSSGDILVMNLHGLYCYDSSAPCMDLSVAKTIVTEQTLQDVVANKDEMRAWLPLPPENYVLRVMHPGERMRVGKGVSKKVSDVLKEGGVPAPWRKEYPVLAGADTGCIVWIPGVRRGYDDRISSDSEYCYLYSASQSVKQ